MNRIDRCSFRRMLLDSRAIDAVEQAICLLAARLGRVPVGLRVVGLRVVFLRTD